jgi:hypothetical protein
MSKLKTYRVTFTDTRHMRIDLEARSPGAAIRAAERLYVHSDPADYARFVDTGGDAFHDAHAEEVRP